MKPFNHLDYNLLMPVDVNAQLHGLHDCHGHLLGKNVRHNVDAVSLGLAGRGGGQEDLKQQSPTVMSNRTIFPCFL